MKSASQFLPLTETLTPVDQGEVAEVVSRAYNDKTAVYPIGGGTQLGYGAIPETPGLGLSLAGVNRLVDYPAQDLTITVEAGVTIAELADRLASQRQRLPVDVPHAVQATIGGVVATALAGPRQYRWGNIRDYVIGLQAVDGTGTTFSGGGRVVKNAAGYNLCRLLTGSLGTLGVITQVTLMVKPVAETSAFVAAEVADFDTLKRLLAQLVKTETLPTAIEFLAGPAWKHHPPLATESQSSVGRLLVGFEGTRAEVDWMTGQVPSEWKSLSVEKTSSVNGETAAGIWERLAEFPTHPPGVNGDHSLAARINVLPGATVELVRLLVELDQNCSIKSHAGDGIVDAWFSGHPYETLEWLNNRLRGEIATSGGSMVVVSSGQQVELSPKDVWGPSGGAAGVMQVIKNGFDPKGILNPGRFAYGNR